MDYLQSLEEIPVRKVQSDKHFPDEQTCSSHGQNIQPPKSELNGYGINDLLQTSTPEGKSISPPLNVHVSPEAGDEGTQLAEGLEIAEELLHTGMAEDQVHDWMMNAFYIVNGAVSKAINMVEDDEQPATELECPAKEVKRSSGSFSPAELEILQQLYPGIRDEEPVEESEEERDEVFVTPTKTDNHDTVIDFTKIKADAYGSPESVEQSYFSPMSNLSNKSLEQEMEDDTILPVNDSYADESVTDRGDFDQVLKDIENTPLKDEGNIDPSEGNTTNTLYRIPKIVIESESDTEVPLESEVEQTPIATNKSTIDPNESNSCEVIENLLSQVKLAETPDGREQKTETDDVSCSSSSKSYSDTFTSSSESSSISSASSQESVDSSAHTVDTTDISSVGSDSKSIERLELNIENTKTVSREETVHKNFVSQDSVSSTSPVCEPKPLASFPQKLYEGKWDLTQLSIDTDDGLQFKDMPEVHTSKRQDSQQSFRDVDALPPSASASEESGLQLGPEEQEALRLLNLDEFQSPPIASHIPPAELAKNEKESLPLMEKYRVVEGMHPAEVKRLQNEYPSAFVVPPAFMSQVQDNITEGEDLGNGNMITDIDACFNADPEPHKVDSDSSFELAPQTFSIYDFNNPTEEMSQRFQPSAGDEGFYNPLFMHDDTAGVDVHGSKQLKYLKGGGYSFGNLAYEDDDEEINNEHTRARPAVADSSADVDRHAYNDQGVQDAEPCPHTGNPDDSVEEYVDGVIQGAIKELQEHPNSAGKNGRKKGLKKGTGSTKGSRAGTPAGGDRPGSRPGSCKSGGRPGSQQANAQGEPVKSKCCCTIL